MSLSLSGRLLVAAPELVDPNFDRTVVFLVEHDDHGALGVVLNRPSHTRVVEHFGELGAMASHPSVFFVGGPVSEESVVVLGRGADDTVELVDLAAVLEGDTPAPGDVRLFAGYAGWGPGQLDAEVATGSWFVIESVAADVFCAHPADLWRDVLRRQPPPLNRLAMYPDDVSVN